MHKLFKDLISNDNFASIIFSVKLHWDGCQQYQSPLGQVMAWCHQATEPVLSKIYDTVWQCGHTVTQPILTWYSSQWRHNERRGISNHQPHDCLFNRLLRRRSRKTSNSASLAFVWGIHWWPVNSPHIGPVTRKVFPFDDVMMQRTRSSHVNAKYFVYEFKYDQVGRFNTKASSHQCRDSHYKDKTASRPSNLKHGIPLPLSIETRPRFYRCSYRAVWNSVL